MEDIAPKLIEDIQKGFNAKTRESRILKSKLLRLKDKNVDFKDASEFAQELGNLLSNVFGQEIKEELLPDGKMYYNIAQRLINIMLGEDFELINKYAKEVQRVLNKNAGLSLKPLGANLNQDRIDGIVNRLAEAEKFSDVAWILKEPVVNFSMAIVDDVVKENADFHYNAGLSPKIIRKESGNCCDWCREIVGVYKYPEVPKDVYRRHRYCKCTVEYIPGDGKKQDVWSKEWTPINKKEDIKRRIDLSKS